MKNKPESFRCPDCKMRSYHPEDIKHSFCGNCHEFKKGVAYELKRRFPNGEKESKNTK